MVLAPVEPIPAVEPRGETIPGVWQRQHRLQHQVQERVARARGILDLRSKDRSQHLVHPVEPDSVSDIGR